MSPKVKVRSVTVKGQIKENVLEEGDDIIIYDNDKAVATLTILEIHDPTPWRWMREAGRWIKVRF